MQIIWNLDLMLGEYNWSDKPVTANSSIYLSEAYALATWRKFKANPRHLGNDLLNKRFFRRKSRNRRGQRAVRRVTKT